MSEADQLKEAEAALSEALHGLRDSFGYPALSARGSAALMGKIGALVDAKMAVREREIITAMRAMLEAADAKP